MEKSFREPKSHLVILILVVLCIALAGAGIYGWVENLALRAAVEELVTEPGEYDPDEGMVYSLAMYDLDSMYVFYGDLYVLAEDAAKEPENQQLRQELQYKLEGIAMARSRPAWPIIYSNFIRVYGDGDQELEETVREVEKFYLKYGTFFEFYDDRKECDPPELMRKGRNSPSEPYHQSFHDYGWSATLYIDMIRKLQLK